MIAVVFIECIGSMSILWALASEPFGFDKMSIVNREIVTEENYAMKNKIFLVCWIWCGV